MNDKIEQEVDEDIQRFVIDFLSKGLTLIYPAVPEGKRHHLAVLSEAVLRVEGDEDTVCSSPENTVLSEYLVQLHGEMKLSGTALENQFDQYNALMNEVPAEVRLYCLNKVNEMMFGGSEPGNYVVDMGFGSFSDSDDE